MTSIHEQLKAWASASPVRYGREDASSLLEMLRWQYVEANPVDSLGIRQKYAALHDRFPGLTLADTDYLFGTVYDLCAEYEKTAFLDGMRLGALLMMELTADTEVS